MRAVVVYESMFGNTHHIADAIGQGLAETLEVEVVPVGGANAEVLVGVDLLVVGGPTHVHGMSSATSRKGAVDQAAEPDSDLEMDPDAFGEGLRDWFDHLPHGSAAAAAFDTRVGTMSALVTGRASKGIAKRLRHHGYHLVGEPTSFGVDSESHLLDGELDKATQWGRTIAGHARTPTR